MGQTMAEAMSTLFDLVLGRKTYDIFAAHWPHATEDDGAKPLNDATKYVASRSNPTLEWGPSVLIEGDVAEGIAALTEEDGPGRHHPLRAEARRPQGLDHRSRSRYLRAGR